VKNKSLILSVFLISSHCYAADNSATQLSLSPSILHFDYTEFSTTDKILNRELGWLPGVEARLSHAISADWLIQIQGAYYLGTVDYAGQTQAGVPHSTDTETKFLRFGGQIEKVIYKKTNLFIGIQSHQWQRDIQDNNNVSGISETYQWIEYSFGLSANILSYQKDLFNIEAAYLITRNATIDVDLSRVNFGSATLDIGNGAGARLILNWQRVNENNTRYGLSLFFEGWDFGRSNTKQTQGGSSTAFVTEPRSKTRIIGLKFIIQHLF